MIPLEICIDCTDLHSALASARAASEGGASRIECCASMSEDGLTPDSQVIATIRDIVPPDLLILAMIRPNPGNFEVEKPDIKRMIASMDKMTRAGADGVVFGCIRGDEIDQPALRALTSAADSLGLETTFHRAFDALIDPVLACNLLADAGIDRILSSGIPWGQPGSAVDGIPVLTEVLNTLEDRIELVVGGGIGQETIPIVVEALADLGMMSLHAYSSVLTNGVTDEHKVRGLLAQIPT
ncbi:MAG: copper homeostasis protein CutC [Bacteroidetes bacterium]|nr:copper homeostasis protein CutC [Bacteroidota bacterium]